LRRIRLLGSIFVVCAIGAAVACGGGSGSGTGGGGAPPPGAAPTPTPIQSVQAAGDITFVVPPSSSAQLLEGANRHVSYVSPATIKFTLVEDGTVAVSQASAFSNSTVTAPNGSTFTISSTVETAGQLVDVHFVTLPGTHTFGIVATDGAAKPNVLSEGQSTWAVSAGSGGNSHALTLAGVAATGYVVCPTLAEIANPDRTCSSYANFSDGTFHLVAVAGDADGFPIYSQPGVAFDNGQVDIVETTAGGNLLHITGGPWSSPGSALNVDGLSAGNSFAVTCARVGTGTVALFGTNGKGTVTGIDYARFAFPPASSILPHGPGTVAKITVPADIKVECQSTGTVTVESGGS
jgi:hypothetical protein